MHYATWLLPPDMTYVSYLLCNRDAAIPQTSVEFEAYIGNKLISAKPQETLLNACVYTDTGTHDQKHAYR